jgi:hypothetical protein
MLPGPNKQFEGNGHKPASLACGSLRRYAPSAAPQLQRSASFR